jgi:hypothetical protein
MSLRMAAEIHCLGSLSWATQHIAPTWLHFTSSFPETEEISGRIRDRFAWIAEATMLKSDRVNISRCSKINCTEITKLLVTCITLIFKTYNESYLS